MTKKNQNALLKEHLREANKKIRQYERLLCVCIDALHFTEFPRGKADIGALSQVFFRIKGEKLTRNEQLEIILDVAEPYRKLDGIYLVNELMEDK